MLREYAYLFTKYTLKSTCLYIQVVKPGLWGDFGRLPHLYHANTNIIIVILHNKIILDCLTMFL